MVASPSAAYFYAARLAPHSGSGFRGSTAVSRFAAWHIARLRLRSSARMAAAPLAHLACVKKVGAFALSRNIASRAGIAHGACCTRVNAGAPPKYQRSSGNSAPKLASAASASRSKAK